MKSIFKYLIFGLIAFFAASSASAATAPSPSNETIKDQTTKVTQSQDNLATIKDNPLLSPEEKLQKEIVARKNIVVEALNLSLKEVENLRNGINKLPEFNADSREAFFLKLFTIQLNNYYEYYSDKIIALKNNTNLKLDEIKAIAKEIIDYRDNNYNPEIRKIVDFILVFYNIDAISTASSRLDKISSDIKKLEKLNLVKADLFKTNLDKATALIKTAINLNVKAKDLILALPESDEDILEDATLEAEKTDEPEIKEPTANELITESLTNIKATYEVFLQISRDIRKAIGIR